MPGSTDVSRRTGGRAVDAVVFDERAIAERVSELGAEITDYYPDGDLLVLGLLKGCFVFLPDLVRHIERPLHVDFLVVASYGHRMESSGEVRLLYDPEVDLRGKQVLLVEDIIDSGNTLARLVRLIKGRKPESLEICTFLHKRLAEALDPDARFVGFDAPTDFLVGYGLDHAENFRHLPFVASIKE